MNGDAETGSTGGGTVSGRGCRIPGGMWGSVANRQPREDSSTVGNSDDAVQPVASPRRGKGVSGGMGGGLTGSLAGSWSPAPEVGDSGCRGARGFARGGRTGRSQNGAHMSVAPENEDRGNWGGRGFARGFRGGRFQKGSGRVSPAPEVKDNGFRGARGFARGGHGGRFQDGGGRVSSAPEVENNGFRGGRGFARGGHTGRFQNGGVHRGFQGGGRGASYGSYRGTRGIPDHGRGFASGRGQPRQWNQYRPSREFEAEEEPDPVRVRSMLQDVRLSRSVSAGTGGRGHSSDPQYRFGNCPRTYDPRPGHPVENGVELARTTDGSSPVITGSAPELGIELAFAAFGISEEPGDPFAYLGFYQHPALTNAFWRANKEMELAVLAPKQGIPANPHDPKPVEPNTSLHVVCVRCREIVGLRFLQMHNSSTCQKAVCGRKDGLDLPVLFLLAERRIKIVKYLKFNDWTRLEKEAAEKRELPAADVPEAAEYCSDCKRSFKPEDTMMKTHQLLGCVKQRPVGEVTVDELLSLSLRDLLTLGILVDVTEEERAARSRRRNNKQNGNPRGGEPRFEFSRGRGGNRGGGSRGRGPAYQGGFNNGPKPAPNRFNDNAGAGTQKKGPGPSGQEKSNQNRGKSAMGASKLRQHSGKTKGPIPEVAFEGSDQA